MAHRLRPAGVPSKLSDHFVNYHVIPVSEPRHEPETPTHCLPLFTCPSKSWLGKVCPVTGCTCGQCPACLSRLLTSACEINGKFCPVAGCTCGQCPACLSRVMTNARALNGKVCPVTGCSCGQCPVCLNRLTTNARALNGKVCPVIGCRCGQCPACLKRLLACPSQPCLVRCCCITSCCRRSQGAAARCVACKCPLSEPISTKKRDIAIKISLPGGGDDNALEQKALKKMTKLRKELKKCDETLCRSLMRKNSNACPCCGKYTCCCLSKAPIVCQICEVPALPKTQVHC